MKIKIIGESDYFQSLEIKEIEEQFSKSDLKLSIISAANDVAHSVDKERSIVLFKDEGPLKLINLVLEHELRFFINIDVPSFQEDLKTTIGLMESFLEENSHPCSFYIKNLPSFKNEFKEEIVERVNRPNQKAALIKKLANYIQGIKGGPSISGEFNLLADECLSNAVYNAPLRDDFENELLDRHDSCNKNKNLSKCVELRVAEVGAKKVLIECNDGYGLLNPRRAMTSIRKNIASGVKRAMNLREEAGGAGIGMRYIFEFCDEFNLLVRPGELTSFCLILKKRRKGKSFPNAIRIFYGGKSMSDFKYTEEYTDDRHIIKISGQINEDSIFKDIDLSKKANIEIDFQDVAGVNSCGIREWIKWLESLPAESKMEWVNCTKEIIDQVNMVDGFLPKSANIKNYFVPYFCEDCNSRQNLIVNNDGNEPECEEEIECKNCNSEAEIDIIESKYFKFLKAA